MAAESGSDTLKIAGWTVALIAAVAMTVHRMPRMGYVEVHEDKPRPRPVAAAAPVEAKPEVRVAALPSAPEHTAKRPPPAEKRPAEAASEAPAAFAPPEPVLNWEDECYGEMGLLCYEVPTEKVPQCLSPYLEALRTGCRRALKSRRS